MGLTAKTPLANQTLHIDRVRLGPDPASELRIAQGKMQTFDANLNDLQPSQLYIWADKLAAVEIQTPSGDCPALDPLPVKRLASRTVLTDGHTRALAALRRGRTFVRAYWDTDDLDWEAYEIGGEWCLREGVRSVADLKSRVIAADEYEELWLERCRAMHARLAEKRAGSTAQRVGPPDR